MNWSALKQFIAEQHLPQYRLRQIFRAYFRELLHDWDALTTLSKEHRLLLSRACPWSTLEEDTCVSGEECIKFRLKSISDGLQIESVIMKHSDQRRTICVSCQVGCALGCTFCATGTMKLQRNLVACEIYDQVIHAARLLKKKHERITNVVVMGMGEPMQNFDAVKESIEILHDPEGLNLGWRHFTISTCGLIKGIRRQAIELPQVNLAVSLHAANEALRTQLMPINKSQPLYMLMPACHEYVKETKRRLFFEYILLAQINDSHSHAIELADLMEQNSLFHVNLIRYHKTAVVPENSQVYRCSDDRTTEQFMDILAQRKISVTLRHSFGEELQAACGQLVIPGQGH